MVRRSNQTDADGFAATKTTDARIFLSDILVDTPNEGAVVVIGDSISAVWPPINDNPAIRLVPQHGKGGIRET